jgi:hypothetical protein
MIRLITDKPDLTGYLDGAKAVDTGSRETRKDQLPEGQQEKYIQGFRRGARDSQQENA